MIPITKLHLSRKTTTKFDQNAKNTISSPKKTKKTKSYASSVLSSIGKKGKVHLELIFILKKRPYSYLSITRFNLLNLIMIILRNFLVWFLNRKL